MKVITKAADLRLSILTTLTIAILPAMSGFADKYKANNSNPLNQSASWTNNAVPTSTEFGVWNSTVTAPNTTNSLGANLTWGGIKILNPGGPVTLSAGNTLTLLGVSGTGIDLSSASQDLAINCGLSLPTSQTWNLASGRALIAGGVMSGSGSLTKTGVGTLTLSGANVYSGATTINAGTLRLGSANVLPDGVGKGDVSVSGKLDLNGYSETVNGLSGTGMVDNVGGGTPTLTVGNNDASSTFSGVIMNTVGLVAINKIGAGTLTLSGANTHTGGTTLSAGTLALNHSSAPGAGSLKITGGSLDNTSGGSLTISQNNAQNWNGDFTFVGTSSLNLGAGAVTLNASRRVTVNASTFTVGGAISGTGFGLTKDGVGTLTLSGASTYTGATVVSGGTLRLAGGSNRLPTASPVTLANAAGATLDLNGNNQTIASLSGGGASGGLVSLGSGTLTVNQATDTSYAGVISGTGGLSRLGTGTLALSGANTYTGPTTVNAGTLLVNGSLIGTSAVTVKTNAALGGSGLIYGPVTVQAGGTLAPGIGIGSLGRLTVSNSLTLAGTTAMDLNKAAGTNDQVYGIISLTCGGTLVVTNLAGTLAAGDSFKLFDAASYAGAFSAISPATPGTGIVWDLGYLPVNGTLAVVSTVGDKYKANNTLPLSQAVSWTNHVVPGASDFAVWDATVAAANLTNELGSDMIWGGIKIINPGGPVTLVSTSNTLTLNGVSGIGIDMSAATADLTINCSLCVSNGVVSFIDPTNHMAIPGSVSGNGGLTMTGGGLLSLSGTNTYTGPTTVNAGTVLVNGKLGGGGAVTVAAGATLGGNGTISGPVTVQAGATLCVGDEPPPCRLCPVQTLTVNNTVTLAEGSTTIMKLNKTAGTNDQVRGITTLTYGGTLVLTNLGPVLQAGDRFKLFDGDSFFDPTNYVSGSFAAISPATPGIGIVWDLSYLPVDGTLRVATAPSLVWSGAVNGIWDIGTTLNWLSSATPTVYTDGSAVFFEDLASFFDIYTEVAVRPGSVTVNATNTYTFTGSGGIAGNASLTKSGSGLLSIEMANSFTGPTVVNGGTLRVKGTLTSTSGVTVKTNGTLSLQATASNTVAGVCAALGTNALSLANTATVQLLADSNTTFAGGSVAGTNVTLTLIAAPVTAGVSNQTLTFAGGGLNLSNASITVPNHGQILALGTITCSGSIQLGGDGPTHYEGLCAQGGHPVDFVGASVGDPALIDTGDWNSTNSDTCGLITGTAGLDKSGTGVLILWATNTYTGPTVVSNGVLVVSGSLAAGSPVTIKTNGTLGGNGTIGGPVTVEAGGRLMPGIGGIGTLTVNNTLSLAGTALMEINRTNTPNSDRVIGLSTVTYGGPGTLTNLGPALQAGDSFTLFTATNYAGSFAALSLPPLSSGLAWDTSDLGRSGTLRVALASPTILPGVSPSEPGTFTLSFPSLPGCTYELEYKDALTDPQWNVLICIVANASLTTLTDSFAPAGHRFYHLVVMGFIPQPSTPYGAPVVLSAMGEPVPGAEIFVEQEPSDQPLFNGEFHHTTRDLVIPGRGPDCVFSRTYRSQAGPDTPIGNGWSSSFDIRVVSNGADFDVYDGTGRTDTYRLQTNGTYAASRTFCEGTYSNLVFTVQFPDTSTWRFTPLDGSASQGKISLISDRNQNTLTPRYDLDGRLVGVIDTLGRTNTVSYNADGFLSAITDFTGRQVTYAYYTNGDAGGSAGDLKSVTSPAVTNTPNGNDFPEGKTVTYTYSKGLADERLNHKLLTITDAKGQTWLRNTYAGTTNPADLNFGRLMSQTRGCSNEVYEFSYRVQIPSPANGGAIIKTIVNGRVGNVAEYFYDATNRLLLQRRFTGRATPGLVTTDTQNRPINQLRASDPAFFDTSLAWNRDSRLVWIRYPNGNVVSNTYESDLNPSASLRSRANVRIRTTLPGPLGGDQSAITERWVYDTTFSCGCGGFNFATQVTDGCGHTTYHAYDNHGNRTNTIHADPSAVEDFEYNNYGQMTAHVLPDNGTGYRRRDVMTYYSSGWQAGYLQQQVVDANGLTLTTSYEYDKAGNPTRVTDPRGNDTLYTYNTLNQVVRERSRPVSTPGGPVRYERDFFYDANNKLWRLEAQNVDENGLLSTNAYLTTIYTYDCLDRLVMVRHEVDPAHNAITQYAYDANGNRTLVVSGEASNGHQPSNVLRIFYDERNKPYHEIRAPGDPAQSTTQFDYDGNGNLVRTSQGLEDAPRTTLYGSDGYNRRTTTTDAMGNVTTFHYDSCGNVLTNRLDGELVDVPGSAGNRRLSETTFAYDAMNRRILTDQSFFDLAAGNNLIYPVMGTNNPTGHAPTTTIYSPNSQVLATIDCLYHTNRTAYDTAHRPAMVTDARGNTTAFTCDPNGNLILTAETDLSDLGSPAQTFFTTNVYDALDRLVLTIDNLGNTNRFAYDSRNNRVVATDPRNNVTRYAYDGLNRLTATTHFLTSNGQGGGTPAGTIVTTQTWDDNSRLTSQTDANNHTTAYLYDVLDRQTRTVFADGTTNGTAYDVHGNRSVTTDANGSVVNWTHDLLNRVSAKSIVPAFGVSATITSEVYQYDGASRVVRAQNNDSLVTRGYDSLSHVTSETQHVVSSGAPARTVTSSYDPLGNRFRCIYPGGRVLDCTYEPLNRPQYLSDLSGPIAYYLYFGPARVEQRAYANDTGAAYAYDRLRRMTNSYHSVLGSGTPIDSRAYTWDAAGNKTADADLLALSQDSKSYAYDSINRLVTSQTAVVGPTITYTLDGVGNRQTVTGGTNAGAYLMYAGYPVNQYAMTPFDARTYDANGNLKSAGAQQFHYDYLNRLTAAAQPALGTGILFKYDCFGRRVEKTLTVGGALAPTRYYYAGMQEIEEQNFFDWTGATYVWGLGIDELLSSARGSSNYYYHADDLGSIRKVTDSAGNVVEQYRYGDYGKPSFFDGAGTPLSGTQIGNATLFTGRRYDPESGLYYYRTRYLDPLAGRFTSRDTIDIWEDEVNLGNGFTYVGNSPCVNADALGMGGPAELWADRLSTQGSIPPGGFRPGQILSSYQIAHPDLFCCQKLSEKQKTGTAKLYSVSVMKPSYSMPPGKTTTGAGKSHGPPSTSAGALASAAAGSVRGSISTLDITRGSTLAANSGPYSQSISNLDDNGIVDSPNPPNPQGPGPAGAGGGATPIGQPQRWSAAPTVNHYGINEEGIK